MIFFLLIFFHRFGMCSYIYIILLKTNRKKKTLNDEEKNHLKTKIEKERWKFLKSTRDCLVCFIKLKEDDRKKIRKTEIETKIKFLFFYFFFAAGLCCCSFPGLRKRNVVCMSEERNVFSSSICYHYLLHLKHWLAQFLRFVNL